MVEVSGRQCLGGSFIMDDIKDEIKEEEYGFTQEDFF